MQNDAASCGKGDGVNQAGKAGAVERILWVHQSGAFSGNLRGDLCFCIGLPIKLACNLAQQVYDPLLIRLLAAESYYDAWRYIPILTLSMIAAAFFNFMGSVYVVTKKSTASLWTSLAGAQTVFQRK